MIVQLANGLNDALSQLGGLGLKVGPKTGQNKRSNADEELWCLRRLIVILAEKSKISWPLSVDQRDKPDFCIIENKHEYGLEITRAVSEEDERELTRAEKSNAGIYFKGEFGGRKCTDALSAAEEIICNVNIAIERKHRKTYLSQRPTDLFIYIKGNNTFWLDGSPVDEDGKRYKGIVCSFKYSNMEKFRNIMLFWDSGELYFIKENEK